MCADVGLDTDRENAATPPPPGAFDPVALGLVLDALPHEGRLAFAISCCERMVPNYLAFHRDRAWGEPEALRQALDFAWQVLSGARPDERLLASLVARCRDAEPDTQDHDTILASSALDAAASVGCVLRFLGERDTRLVVDIASMARDSVDMYVQEVEAMRPGDKDIEARILAHPLMRRELARQTADIALLRRTRCDRVAAEKLAEMWRAPASGNLGV